MPGTEAHLMADGPVVMSILETLKGLQIEQRENVRTMAEIRVDVGKISTRVENLLNDNEKHQLLAERTARLEADRETMRSRMDGMSATLKWSVGLAIPSIIGVIGLIFTLLTMVRGK